jgi:hypothetical protein
MSLQISGSGEKKANLGDLTTRFLRVRELVGNNLFGQTPYSKKPFDRQHYWRAFTKPSDGTLFGILIRRF